MKRLILSCLLSAMLGGIAGGFAVSATQSPSRGANGATGATGPRGPQGAPSIANVHGGYVVGDVDQSGMENCPRGTTATNVELHAETNSPSGHSAFVLCALP